MQRNTRTKIVTPKQLAAIADDARAQGKKIVHCHGVFDLVHPGHINYFEQAKKLADILYVGVIADLFVKKGPDRPRFKQDVRMPWVAALECVDYVVLNEEEGPWSLMRACRPHYYAKGDTERPKLENPESGLNKDKALMEELGGELRFTPEVEIHSTDLFRDMDL
jgi:rfaE bifunctional protein nucleotidyltransferase chain/domain